MFPSILFAFIVLVLLVDELWASYQKSSAKILIPFLYIALYALFFSTIDVVANASKIKDLSDKIPQSKELRISANQETTKIQRIRSFIDSCNVTTPKVFVFCSNRYQGLYMESSKMRSALNPGFLDLFYKSDLQRYVQTVIDSSFNIFMDVQGFYYPNCENIRAAVSQHYYSEKELRDTTSVTVAFLKKRKVEMPKTSFFKEDQTQIYYEKYRDDSLGNQRRIALAGQGIDSLVFPDEFSYEVLVYPDAHQICRGAAIIGNATDSSGFCICKSTIKTDSQAYIILRGNQAVSINLTPNTWHYIVVGISGERMVVIDNNTLVARVIFPRAYQNKTSTNLFIGNLTTRRNFNGLISEVSIKKGLIVEEEIHKT